MRKFKFTLIIAVMLALIVSGVFGCYFIQGQPLSQVKGTYELTSYSRTNGKTNAVTNYVTNGYKAYLVVTGTCVGYYVFTNSDTEPTVRKVSLTYVYGTEDTTKVEYVHYKFLDDTTEYKFGVTSQTLNFSRPAIKISDEIYSDGLSMTFRKIDGDITLSHVEGLLETTLEIPA